MSQALGANSPSIAVAERLLNKLHGLITRTNDLEGRLSSVGDRLAGGEPQDVPDGALEVDPQGFLNQIDHQLTRLGNVLDACHARTDRLDRLA